MTEAQKRTLKEMERYWLREAQEGDDDWSPWTVAQTVFERNPELVSPFMQHLAMKQLATDIRKMAKETGFADMRLQLELPEIFAGLNIPGSICYPAKLRPGAKGDETKLHWTATHRATVQEVGFHLQWVVDKGIEQDQRKRRPISQFYHTLVSHTGEENQERIVEDVMKEIAEQSRRDKAA